ncbi:hypothetical protein V494_02229 [Pseudogymnoascus sp. VKM F-4513 (FW-928)]|nr:hypothetical protein V494_02229 [Pseudogymnoascus sp. VKM F-4513 (FW-928)]
MQTSDHPIISYAFTIFVLLLLAVDRVFQWRTLKERSQKYLILQTMFLGIILLVDASLIFYIEFKISKQKTTWFPALWALLGLSILLSLSIGATASWRMCRGLFKVDPLRQFAYRFIFSATVAVLVFDSTAFVFLSLGFHSRLACILVALVNSTAQGFLSYFSVLFLIQQSPKETVPQKLHDTMLAKRAWGALCCSSISFIGAVMSIALIALPDIDQFLLGELVVDFLSAIPWIALQAYKLTKSYSRSCGVV